MNNWHEYFTANLEAGLLTWKVRGREHFATDLHWKTWNTKNAGKVAGTVNRRGYRKVILFYKPHYAHRILWEMANNSPIREGYEIDHWDRNKSNNSLSNLREVTSSENKRNTGLRSDNTSGVKGVVWCEKAGKWQAQIQNNGRNIFLGYFTVFEDAVAARQAAELKYFGEFNPVTNTSSSLMKKDHTLAQ